MSRYVSTRQAKIQELDNTLKSINNRIDSYISILEDIKKEHNIFDILVKRTYSEYDPTIYFYTITLSFNYLSEDFYISFYNFNKIDSNNTLPIDYIPTIQSIIDIINKKTNYTNVDSDLFYSHSIFKSIRQFYHDIKKKLSDFTLKSNIVIECFKKLVKEQIIEEDNSYKYIYVKPKKDNQLEVIDFTFKYTKYYSSIQLKFPILKEIEKIYSQINVNSGYNKGLYITIFKQEFIRLNKHFCDIFLITEDYIDFDFFSNFITFNTDYDSLHFSYDFHINYLSLNDIEKIADKIEINKQMSNF